MPGNCASTLYPAAESSQMSSQACTELQENCMPHRYVVLLCCGRKPLQSREVEAVFTCTTPLAEVWQLFTSCLGHCEKFLFFCLHDLMVCQTGSRLRAVQDGLRVALQPSPLWERLVAAKPCCPEPGSARPPWLTLARFPAQHLQSELGSSALFLTGCCVF